MNNLEKIYFNNKHLSISKTISTGDTAIIHKTDCGRVVKLYKKRKASVIDRESFWLNKLETTGIVPQLYDIDHKLNAILIEDVGTPISECLPPADWRIQLQKIQGILRQYHCHHNDLSEREILVKNDRISLVDFGFASLGIDTTCGGRFPAFIKKRTVDDNYISNLIELFVGHNYSYAEPHCFVLWDTGKKEAVESLIASKFTIVFAATYHPTAFNVMGKDRVSVLNRFYGGRISNHGTKGIEPFIVYMVFDESPVYEKRRNPFNLLETTVNINTFDLKNSLREGRTSFLHATDNIQESYDNLEALTFYRHRVPVCYWEIWRRKFLTLEEIFYTLNETSGLEYVILRNFEDLTDNFKNRSNDLDILVNDYFLFKRVAGLISYKHKLPKEHPSAGPAYEYGGYKVAGKASIEGREVSVDVRFIGDNYYDKQWEQDILKSRVQRKCFFIPEEIDLIFSLLYHTLVHKRQVSDDYRKTITHLAKNAALLNNETKPLSDSELWAMLDAYMLKKQYKYVRPSELNLPFNARERAGISIETDLKNAQEMFLSKKFLESRHLLLHVLADDPKNKKAKILLKQIKRQHKMEDSSLLLYKKFINKCKIFLVRFQVVKTLRRKFIKRKKRFVQ
jgi:hypothetical protein